MQSRFFALMVLCLSFPAMAQTYLNEVWQEGQASREDFSIGRDQTEVFMVDHKPTEVGDEDRRWFQMLLRPDWTYSRATFVRMRGKAFTSYGGVLGQEVFADWRGEVSWQSYILQNDGKRIIELRYYPANNRILFVETKAEVRCDACISAGKYLDNISEEWRKSEDKKSVVSGVQTWIGELMHLTGLTLQKATYRFDEKRARRVAEMQSGQAEGTLSESMFSNAWYLLLFNTEQGQTDKIARVDLQGDTFTPWRPLTEADGRQETVRRQVISRSAYLMDAALLPPDRKVDEVGKGWTVPANAFGQVLGSDVAAELDQIAGTVSLVRRKNIFEADSSLVRITKEGSARDNRVQFIYKPKKGMIGDTHQSVQVEPESITVLFDETTTNISNVDFQGAAHVSSDVKNLLLPDVHYSTEPFFEAEYASRILDRESWGSAMSNGAGLPTLFTQLLGVSVDHDSPRVSPK